MFTDPLFPLKADPDESKTSPDDTSVAAPEKSLVTPELAEVPYESVTSPIVECLFEQSVS